MFRRYETERETARQMGEYSLQKFNEKTIKPNEAHLREEFKKWDSNKDGHVDRAGRTDHI